MTIISDRKRIEQVSYSLQWRADDGGGWAPECDQHGNVDVSKMNECVRGYWERFTENGVPREVVEVEGRTYRFAGVERRNHSFTEPAIGLCDCGQRVSLGGFTNTCGCGCDYNMSGSLLAHRSQWGEETGESASDILSVA